MSSVFLSIKEHPVSSSGKRIRSALATTLSAALILGGVALSAPAAYAEEEAPAEVTQAAETTEAPATEAPATEETPKTEDPETEEPADEVPTSDEKSAEESEQGADESEETGPATEGSVTQKSTSSSRAAFTKSAASPQLSVSKSTRLDPAGEEITVSGSGYDPTKSIYLSTCTDIALADLTFEFINDGCTSGAKAITALGAPYGTHFNADGSFEVKMTVSPKTGSTALYSIADHTAMSDRSQDAKVVLHFIGDSTDTPGTPTQPKPDTKPRATGGLSWGISSGFAAYTTGDIAEGSITSKGVGKSGGRFMFPQATGTTWDFAKQTGTVRYSGVVTFSGHGGAMSETYANPIITVASASSGTLKVHGQSLTLNLAKAKKTVGAGGAVTWSNVPVSGGISGGGSTGGESGGGVFGYDSLTFTVGSASTVKYGSTTTSAPPKEGPADEAPTDEGITVLTPEDELVAGGEIEIETSGFEADEKDILAVIYSDPIVLDENAGADESGKVHWIGTLPEDLHGEHTLTLQGSTDVGVKIYIMTQEEYDAAHAEEMVTTLESGDATVSAAGPAEPAPGVPGWAVWTGVLALVVVAGGMTALVVAQRRRNAA